MIAITGKVTVFKLDNFNRNRCLVYYRLEKQIFCKSWIGNTTSLHLPIPVLQLGNHQPSPFLDVQTPRNFGDMKSTFRLLLWKISQIVHLGLRDWDNTRSIILSKRFIIFHPNPYTSTKLCLTDKAHGTPLIEARFQRLYFTSWARRDVYRLFRLFDLVSIFICKPTNFVPLLICKYSIYSKLKINDQLCRST